MFGLSQLNYHGVPDLAERGRLLTAVIRCATAGLFCGFPRQMDAYPQGVSVLLGCGHRLILPNQGVRVWRTAGQLWGEQTMPLDPPGEDRTADGRGLRRLVVPS